MQYNIGELLVENCQISQQDLADALLEVEKTGECLGTALLRLGFVTEDNLKTVLELQFGLNYIDLKKAILDHSVAQFLPLDVMERLQAVPVQREGNRLTVAMVYPEDQAALSELQAHLRDWQLKTVVCSDDGFYSLLNSKYKVDFGKIPSNQGEFIELVPDSGSDSLANQNQLSGSVGENRAMILLTHHILSSAINKGCSNIHIEPNDRQVLVHYRKEGILFAARKLPKSILPQLVKMFENMAARASEGLPLPYDGLLKVRHGRKNFSFRLSIVPGAFGEHLVIWLE